MKTLQNCEATNTDNNTEKNADELEETNFETLEKTNDTHLSQNPKSSASSIKDSDEVPPSNQVRFKIGNKLLAAHTMYIYMHPLIALNRVSLNMSRQY